MVQDKHTITTEPQYKVIYGLSNNVADVWILSQQSYHSHCNSLYLQYLINCSM